MSTHIDALHLKTLMDRDVVKILDASWDLNGTDLHAVFKSEHIPGAQFFDLEGVANRDTDLPHMAPSPDVFAKAVGDLGINNEDYVVIYDQIGLFSAARVWWTFKLMGHDRVTVLRGGLPAWKAAGMPISSEVSEPITQAYIATQQDPRVISLDSMKSSVSEGRSAILDARPKARFDGDAPEPRPGLRSGHMRGAKNLPLGELIRDGGLKSREELEAIFKGLKVDEASAIITTCGSGVTAAIITMALYETGRKQTRLYDGSWAEWGRDDVGTEVVSLAEA